MVEYQPILPAFGTYERILHVKDANEGGFFPATHLEKNAVLTLADYLNSPEKYPGGIHHHHMEVYDHQIAVARKKDAKLQHGRILGTNAVKSILWTYGDFLHNAVDSVTSIHEVNKVLEDTPNPRIALAEALEDQDVPILKTAALARHQVLALYYKQLGLPLLGFDPLKTIELRENPLPGANKRIVDSFTTERPSYEASEYIMGFAEAIKVKQARDLAKAVLHDQVMRKMYWLDRLRESRGTFRSHALSIIEAVKASQSV